MSGAIRSEEADLLPCDMTPFLTYSEPMQCNVVSARVGGRVDYRSAVLGSEYRAARPLWIRRELGILAARLLAFHAALAVRVIHAVIPGGGPKETKPRETGDNTVVLCAEVRSNA